jgi:hypothetical protein
MDRNRWMHTGSKGDLINLLLTFQNKGSRLKRAEGQGVQPDFAHFVSVFTI